MPKVKMLIDAAGSPDGVTVNQYEAGKTYDVPEALSDTFMKYDLAERAAKPGKGKKAAPPENKQDDPPAENKSESVDLTVDDVEPGILRRLLHGSD
jgi:hypothetical protein